MPISSQAGARYATARMIVRVTAGNFLEQFDFFLFGFYATQIAAVFFPQSSKFASLMLTFVVFGVGFLMRPLGAVVLGAYIDKAGRRKGLILTLSLMASGTLLIAFVPGHDSIGLLAPMLVLVGRLLQGFSAGAELGGVSVYLAEMATPGHKGFFTSWQSASQQLSIILAAALGFAVNHWMEPAAVSAWGWRIPFFVGCLIIPLLFVLRRNLEETREFMVRTQRPTLGQAVKALWQNARLMVAGALLVAMTTTAFYLITVYAPTFGKTVLNLSTSDSLIVTFYVGVSNFIWLPLGGALSDKIGRRPVLLTMTALTIVTAYPVLSFLAYQPSFVKMLAVLLWFSFLFGMYNGALVPALTEVMPKAIRAAGFSLAYSLATAIFGGFTPAVSTALIQITEDHAAPAYWMMLAALCALGAVLVLYAPNGRLGKSYARVGGEEGSTLP